MELILILIVAIILYAIFLTILHYLAVVWMTNDMTEEEFGEYLKNLTLLDYDKYN